ncbi:vacuolar sorting-associated, putative [Babesia caballi]|uniref:Vacuolar protein sorting-associated protein 51 homolog n=1 Tax=Babesia caballi TaxID=5871 RepID=A0AAV4M1V8_BABCB|nr:vacuolar sorting-associated, putative [Babesia caballi]
MKNARGLSGSKSGSAEAETSVSALLSSFYDVGAASETNASQENTGETQNGQATWDDAILSGAIFGYEDFDVDSCLTTALKKYSMVELIALLRRLEREVRQFTAGKQILIYDNYECLFTALDTVHEINSDLTVVQKRLQTLKSSQIKASSIDISSRYGFREKLRGITELNRVLNIYQALACIATCLNRATQSSVMDTEERGHMIRMLELVAKVYVILNVIREQAGPKATKIKLLHTFNKSVKELVPSVAKGLCRLAKSEQLSHNVLVSVCCNLAMTHLTARQVWELYWLNKAHVLENRLNNLVAATNDPKVSLHHVSNDLIDFLLYLREAVHSDGYSKLARCIEESGCGRTDAGVAGADKPGVACLFCVGEDYEVVIVEGNGTESEGKPDVQDAVVYSHYWIAQVGDGPCNCVKDSLPQQLVLCYAQLAFAALQPRLVDRTKPLTCNELMYVLTSVVDKLKTVAKEEAIVKLLVDVSYRWILLTVLLYLQKQFYPVYDAMAGAILPAESKAGKEAYNGIYTAVERILKDEVTDILPFIDDLSGSMGLSLQPLFTSFLIFYIASLKSVYNVQFDTLVSVSEAKQGEEGYLGSVASLTTLRGSSGAARREMLGEHVKESRASARRVEADGCILGAAFDEGAVDAELLSIRLGLSLEHYLRWMLRRKAEELSPTCNTVRGTLTQMVASMVRFNAVFDRIKQLVAQRVGSAAAMLSTGDIEMTLPAVAELATAQVNTTVNRSTYISGLMDYAVGYNRLERLFGDHGVHLTAMTHAIYRFAKSQSTAGLFPLVEAAGDATGKAARPSLSDNAMPLDVPQVTIRVLSYVMVGCIRNASTLMRYAMEGLEHGARTADDAIKDFTGVVYDLVEFLNATADPALSGETTYIQVAELNRKLKYMTAKADTDAFAVIQDLSFVPAKDLCLKLFTIQVAQSIARAARQHVVRADDLAGLVSRIEKQLVLAFKKSADAEQMKRVFAQLATSDAA